MSGLVCPCQSKTGKGAVMAVPNGITRLVWSNVAARSAEQVALAAVGFAVQAGVAVASGLAWLRVLSG